MQTLNVFEKGFGYLEACLAYYSDNCAYFVLYLLALVFVALKGDKREKQIFLPSALFLLLTVYNPVAPVVLDRFFDVNSEYYRFFWIAPVIVLLPYMAAKLILLGESTGKRLLLGGILVVICLFSGNFLYENGYVPATNPYKMPEEMIEVSELIHKDSGDAYPKAFLEYEYNMQMRQYDPKMLLTVDREDYLYAVQRPYTEEMLQDMEHPQYKLLAALIRYQPVEEEAFLSALDETNTEYVVVSKDNRMLPFLENAGLYEVAQTENHRIFKYGLRDKAVFELVDYSEVYREHL